MTNYTTPLAFHPTGHAQLNQMLFSVMPNIAASDALKQRFGNPLCRRPFTGSRCNRRLHH